MAKFINGETDYEEWRDHSKDNSKYIARMHIITTMREKVYSGEELTINDYIRLVQCICPSKLSGKLESFYSVSTSCLMNSSCQGRACLKAKVVDGVECWPVCKFCYAADGICKYSALTQSLETNTLVLREFDIPLEAWGTLDIPTTNGKARIESHGEVNNVQQAVNYLRIIRSHQFIGFTVFSHNDHIWARAIAQEGKPANMMYVHSSLYVNIPNEPIPEMEPYTDHVFTVYTREFATSHNIRINCGEYDEDLNLINHKCRECMKCYMEGTEYYINEMLKEDK